jgi:hypothetical protein
VTEFKLTNEIIELSSSCIWDAAKLEWELSSVLGIIKESTQEHGNYLGHLSTQDAGCYHYRFHIDGDKNREVKLAVMVFHVPK